MTRRAPAMVVAATVLTCVVVAGCNRSADPTATGSTSSLASAPGRSTGPGSAGSASAAGAAAPGSARGPSGGSPGPADVASSGSAAHEGGAHGDGKGPATAVSLGPVVDLGPAQLVAIGAGVVATLDATSDLRVRELAAVAPPKDEIPDVEALAPTAPVLVGPSPTYAYWIAAGQLRRRHIRDGRAVGEAEALTENASGGIGITAVRAGGSRAIDVVAYVGMPQGDQGERPARLWVQGQGSMPLSRESGNSTAVGLVARDERRLLAFTLDGRLGMSLLHAVTVEVDEEGRARLGEDRVVYVGGSAERNTRFDTMRVGERVLVLLPIANEQAGFGLASLLVPEGRGEALALWRHYPNGLDPAPVAGALVCGAPHVAYARPAEARVDAPHLVELAAIGADGALGPALQVGRAGRVAQVVMVGAPEPQAKTAAAQASPPNATAASASARPAEPKEMGGWIAYAADTGLWAHPLRCGSSTAR